MINSSDSGQGEQTRAWRVASQRFGSSLLVLLVGVGATLIASYLQYRARTSEAREEFSAWCEERQQRLTRTIDTHIEVLYGIRALFDSSQDVSLQEFQRYALDALDRHEHLRSIGFLRPVIDSDRAQFEAHYSQVFGTPFAIVDPGPDGQLVTAPSRPEYLPLVYTQKNDPMPAGIDALRNPQMPGVLRALRRGSRVSALVVPMVEEGHSRRFVHVYLPVYSHYDASEVPTQPFGYVRLRLVLEEMLDAITSEARKAGIEATLTLPDGASDTQQGEGEVTSDPAGMGRFMWSGAIEFADRSLLLQFRTTPDYGKLPGFLASWPMLLMGTTLTLLGTFGAYSLSRSRQESQSLADRLLVQMRERQLSEERTAQSEERYRVLVENSPDAILLFRELRAVFVNRAARQLFGAKSDADLLGRGILDLVHPDSRAAAQKRIEKMHADPSILPPFEQKLIRLDGSIVDVELRTVPFIADGDLVLQIAVRDITERRTAERERASLEAALRQSQRLEAIGTFTGGIAHDFNNILSSIVGNIQLVLDDLPRPHPARQSAHEIRNATNRARDLVKRLMAFSREQEAPLTPVELPPLIEEVRQLLRPTMPSGVALEVQLPANTPSVVGNATQLHQILVNLCTNAWQAMSSGQGRIDIIVSTVDADKARSESKAPLQGAQRYVCIEVRDDGNGMDPAIVDRIFEPFFTTKRAGEGSGLGLAVVHGIVQGHKGAIRTTTRLGQGTSFHLYLPASESSDQKTVVAEKGVARGANQHVLYIDDEEPLVFLVTRVLERNGYRCTGTTDPQQGVDTVRASPGGFDLVITDMNMPGLSGIDVARQVLAIRPDLPVLITTGYVRASDVAVTRELGVRDLILKPDTIEELGATVARYLQSASSSPPA